VSAILATGAFTNAIIQIRYPKAVPRGPNHKIPLLWRIHRVHHSDIEFDVTTAIRFHPVEIALSMGFKIGLVYLLGPAAWTVVVFEILLNGSAMFNHANIALPKKLDRVIRSVLVTPDMHRIHHSAITSETNSNYGFSLSIWDRLFGTYHREPALGHEKMVIGLEYFRDEKELYLHRLWIQPALNPEPVKTELTDQ